MSNKLRLRSDKLLRKKKHIRAAKELSRLNKKLALAIEILQEELLLAGVLPKTYIDTKTGNVQLAVPFLEHAQKLLRLAENVGGTGNEQTKLTEAAKQVRAEMCDKLEDKAC